MEVIELAFALKLVEEVLSVGLGYFFEVGDGHETPQEGFRVLLKNHAPDIIDVH